MKSQILLFDGVCNLCNATVQFVLKRDKNHHFKFASLQSEFGQNFLEKHNLETTDFNTFILIEGNSYSIRSTAILKVFKRLEGFWKTLYAFIITPKIIRDSLYDVVARNRYSIFGKKKTCMIPIKKYQQGLLNSFSKIFVKFEK